MNSAKYLYIIYTLYVYDIYSVTNSLRLRYGYCYNIYTLPFSSKLIMIFIIRSYLYERGINTKECA